MLASVSYHATSCPSAQTRGCRGCDPKGWVGRYCHSERARSGQVAFRDRHGGRRPSQRPRGPSHAKRRIPSLGLVKRRDPACSTGPSAERGSSPYTLPGSELPAVAESRPRAEMARSPTRLPRQHSIGAPYAFAPNRFHSAPMPPPDWTMPTGIISPFSTILGAIVSPLSAGMRHSPGLSGEHLPGVCAGRAGKPSHG